MNEIRLTCPPRLDKESGSELFKRLRHEKVTEGQTLVLDFSETEFLDSLGGARLIEISDHLRRWGGQMRLENEHGDVAEFLKVITPALSVTSSIQPKEVEVLEKIGGTAITVGEEIWQFIDLCIDAIYWTVLGPLEGKGFRWGMLLDEMHEMGVRAIGIVCMMNFLLGLIIAMLSAKQVENYGVQILVADAMMIGFARELAAVMTAVVVAARTGAAIAAELATMKVQEEIDALRGMGLNVAQFLVAPKLLSLVLMLPCLWVLGLITSLSGGFVWGVFVLKFNFSVWYTETLNAAHFQDLLQGFLKTIAFAIAIALIGCHNGLRVTGGSRGVGLMTTRAVVMDIFVMICIDIVFATIFYYILG
ncbi:MAG TPA: ABC transporter permease [Candidatus Hydrogenedentes bacterium]|nr:ABC transporter permease [Candidatus Hydrogenedentota bacterium]